jgi:hypothetical protein
MNIRAVVALTTIMVSLSSYAPAATIEAQASLMAPPIKQSFIGVGASVVSDGQQASCKVFSGIDVRASHYASPAGDRVPFSEVKRSPAAGLWINESQPPDATSSREDWRIVLKYPVDMIKVRFGTTEIGANTFLDPAGDSVTLGPALIKAIRASWQRGETVYLVGTSRDTRRRIVDMLVPPSREDLETCAIYAGAYGELAYSLNQILFQTTPRDDDRSNMDGKPLVAIDIAEVDELQQTPQFFAAGTDLVERGPIRVSWADRIPGEINKERLMGCAMTDLGTSEIERYRLTEVTGFVSHSSETWITRDEQGNIQQVYIPGVFEAIRDPQTDTWIASVSISAFANDPFERPVYKGCLGSLRLEVIDPLSGLFAQGLPDSNAFALQSLPGDIPLSSSFGAVTLLPSLLGNGSIFSRVSPTSLVLENPTTFSPPSSPFDPELGSLPNTDSEEIENNELTPVPLPAAGWMLLFSIMALFAMRQGRCSRRQ